MVLLCFRADYFAPQKLEFYVSEMKQVNQKYLMYKCYFKHNLRTIYNR